MPIAIELREDHHVIYTKITDPVSVDDFDNATLIMTPLYDNALGKVHQLVNAREMRRVPQGIMRIRTNTPILNHRNRGQLVMVGANTFLRSIAEIMFKLVQFDSVKFFSTDDEAWIYLRNVIANEQELTS